MNPKKDRKRRKLDPTAAPDRSKKTKKPSPKQANISDDEDDQVEQMYAANRNRIQRAQQDEVRTTCFIIFTSYLGN